MGGQVRPGSCVGELAAAPGRPEARVLGPSRASARHHRKRTHTRRAKAVPQRQPATHSQVSRHQSAAALASMPPGRHSVSIESLPDPLMGRIFAAAGRQAGVSTAACPCCFCRWLCCREPRQPPLLLLLLLLLAVSCC